MMTRLVSWLFFISLGVIAVLLLLPGFIDWTRHKDLLVKEISAQLGQDVRIGGDVSLHFFPNPQITLQDVTIGPAGAQYLLKLAKLEGRMSLGQLLHGRFEIDHIHLDTPVVNIAAVEGGSNWAKFWRDLHAGNAQARGKLVILKQVSVSHGALSWQITANARPWRLEQINLTLAASSLAGPYAAKGDMLYGGEPVTFTLQAGPKTAQGELPFALAMLPIENLPVMTLKGALRADGQGFAAEVSTSEGSLGSLLRAFPDLHEKLGRMPVLSALGDASFALAVNEQGVSLKNIKAKGGKNLTLAGDVLFPSGKAVVQADVTFTEPRYWQSFKGDLDLARGVADGAATFKIEDLGRVVKGLPAISAEASGRLRHENANWTMGDLRLTLPEWQKDGAFTGNAQGTAQGTDIKLEGGAIGPLTAAGVEARVLPAGEISGTLRGSLNEQAFTAGLSGQSATPDIALDLAALPPQQVLAMLGLKTEAIALEGGSSAFKGQLDLGAASAGAAIKGVLSLSPEKIAIANFNPAGLQKALLALDKTPDDLAAQLLAALKEGKGSFKAKPLSFDLPLQAKGWEMKTLAYNGGTFDLAVTGTQAAVAVSPSAEGMPSYKGTLPLTEKELPVEGFAALIAARHPLPQVDTKDAIGGILDRLDADAPVEETPPVEAPALPADLPMPEDAVLKPPADMPPQPLPALPEIDVAPPPALPEDAPLAVEPPPAVFTPEFPEEIFPVEQETAPAP